MEAGRQGGAPEAMHLCPQGILFTQTALVIRRAAGGSIAILPYGGSENEQAILTMRASAPYVHSSMGRWSRNIAL